LFAAGVEIILPQTFVCSPDPRKSALNPCKSALNRDPAHAPFDKYPPIVV